MMRFAPAPLLLVTALVLLLTSCADDDDGKPVDPSGNLTTVLVQAETTLRDPDLLVETHGDVIAPHSEQFSVHAFRRFDSREIDQDGEMVLIDGVAWANEGDGWVEQSAEDPEVLDSFIMTSGGPFTELDWSGLEKLSGVAERANGVSAVRITLGSNDADIAASILGIDSSLLQLGEFTIWLAEEGGGLLALRLVGTGPYPIISSDEPDPTPGARPQRIELDSYHYDLILAAKKHSNADDGVSEYDIEFVFAISRPNDESIEIKAPN